MAILQYGTSVTEFYEGDPNQTGDTTTSIAPYVRRGLITRNRSPLAYLTWTNTSEVWVSFYMRMQEDDASGTIIVIYDDNGDAIFRMVKNYNSWSNIDFDWYDGSTWRELLGSWGGNFTSRARWDFRFKIDPTYGAIDLYKNGSPYGNNFRGDTSASGTRTGTTQFRVGSWGGGGYCIQSAVIIADEPTLDMQYIQTWPAADGTYTEWAGGDYTQFDSVDVSDSTFVESDTTGQRQTYTQPTLTTDFDTGYDVLAVCSSVRAFKGADAGKNLRHVVRSGTTDGFGSDQTVEMVRKPFKEIFTTNPDTGSAWTISEAKAAELGFQTRD